LSTSRGTGPLVSNGAGGPTLVEADMLIFIVVMLLVALGFAADLACKRHLNIMRVKKSKVK
jgi:hypothetical protein